MDLRIKGNWNVMKGKLKEKYGQLTDDDLAIADAEEDKIVGMLQKKLGKTKAEIEHELSELVSD